MADPSVTETIRDGGLNVVVPVSMLPVVLGPASAGDFNEFTLFSDANALKDAHGDGMGILQAVACLADGGPIGFVRAQASVAGSISTTRGVFTEVGTAGTVGETPAGAGPTVTVDASAATRSCTIDVKIETAGALATMAFQVRVNGGAYGAIIPSAAAPANTYTVPDTGVVVTFPAGTYVDDTVYDVTITQGGGVITPSGTPYHDHYGRIEILEDGILGTAKFRFCFDGYSGDTASERTYSDELTVPSGGVYVVPNQGVTLTFTAGNFYEGDVYTFTGVAAGVNATNLADAFAPLTLTETVWRFACVATGDAQDSTACALLETALEAQLDAIAVTSKYRRGIVPAGGGNGTHAACATAFASMGKERALTVYNKCRRATTKPTIGFAYPITQGADVVAARATRSLPSTDLKRVLDGPHASVVKLFDDNQKVPTGLGALKITTLRTWPGKGKSAYITEGMLRSSPGSDFTIWPLGIVLDIACEVAHAKLVDAVGRGLRNETIVSEAGTFPGVLDRRDAGPIDDDVTNALTAALVTPINAEGVPGHVVGLDFEISQTHNFLSTGVIVATLSIQPLGYVRDVVTSIGFVVALPATE